MGSRDHYLEARLLSGNGSYGILRRARELTMASIELKKFTFLNSTLRYKVAAP